VRSDKPEYDDYDKLVLGSWRYAVMLSLSVTTAMLLLGALDIRLRDGRLHDIDVLLFGWTLMNAVFIPAIRWENRRR